MARYNDDYAFDRNRWEKSSIYRLPHFVTKLNKNAYTPHAVSFGPYHHGKDNLKAMQEHKNFALELFLERSNNSKENCIKYLQEVAQDLKDSYSCLDHPWDDDTDKFLELLLLDGCFMFEVLRMSAPNFGKWSEYPRKHPIFSHHGKLHIMPFIKRDMLMLENQLPLLVLLKLTAIGNVMENDMINLILQFCHRPSNLKRRGNYEFMHVLDVYRWSLLPEESSSNSGQGNQGSSNACLLGCATELHSAGVNLMTSKTEHLTDVSFKRGKLKLPIFVVDDTTESIFLNIIAFERFHVGLGNEVTSYIFLMDNLIDCERDVSLLHEHKIIQNFYGSPKAVAKLFNSLSKETALELNGNLGRVVKNVNDYCKMPFHKWRAYYCHTYFRSPWALISLVAAIVLFSLSMVQTTYDLMDYYKKS